MPIRFNLLPFLLIPVSLFFASCSKSSDSKSPSSVDSTVVQSKILVDTYSGKLAAGSIHHPTALALDSKGVLYASEPDNNVIVKIDPFIQSVGTLTGDFNDPGCLDAGAGAPSLTFPENMWVDDNDLIYVGDRGCGSVKVVRTTGGLATIQYENPNGYLIVPIGASSNAQGDIYIADEQGMYMINHIDHILSRLGQHGATIITDGGLSGASFGTISAFTQDKDGNMYIADSHRIRKISGNSVTTIAGSNKLGFDDGSAASASFGGAMAICTDNKGNIFVTDYYNNAVRKVSASGAVTTLAGNGHQGYNEGAGNIATFYEPSGIAYRNSGNGVLYVSDFGNNVIRRVILP
ncbi:hypothetical protein [Mucilaginibacter sp.]|uniref:hypothetical protein n=1 Tax=Mucilaginibacter sp. TaxID=1882438 RepID=UPI0035BBFA1F